MSSGDSSWRMDLASGILGTMWNTAAPIGPQDMVLQRDSLPTMADPAAITVQPAQPPPQPAHPQPQGSQQQQQQEQQQEPRQQEQPQNHQQQQHPSTSGPSAMARDFISWITAQGLTGHSRQALMDHGVISCTILAGLEPEDAQEMGITTLGQRRLLQRLAQICRARDPIQPGHGVPQPVGATAPGPSPQGLGDTRQGPVPGNQAPTAPPAPQPLPACPEEAGLSHQLASLLAALPTASGGPAPTAPALPPGLPVTLSQAASSGPSFTGERVDLNPLSYLLPVQKVKFRDITDYIGLAETGEHVLESREGSQLLIRTGPKKPRIEQVTPMQWCAANMRIMVEMLRDGDLAHVHLMDYVAYTIKVSELANKYTWLSVLYYDQAYRRMQQSHKFRWGSDAPHLTSLHLIPRNPSKPTSAKGGRTSDAAKKTVICRNYNNNRCAYTDCKFQHICSVANCGQAHPATQHDAKK